ncbi:hypothetical protein ACOQFV_22975 [Nocardiopsis changdeensis]|uniref:Uncharacterized protein n=1 Tax=Nocardiopsis changdeensis TaxID=2831969 RepID=A0ABX8BNH4_9ACTN|nr:MULTISPECIES: hypothetical protein [Nocardiopsis]QUX21953.1 hypothetical protein KGD84_26890 [Nocardiopsis changdeensis]QYX37889.1 hypothetical protein K1J57_04285 [Nocardiopsis sp. MT53]
MNGRTGLTWAEFARLAAPRTRPENAAPPTAGPLPRRTSTTRTPVRTTEKENTMPEPTTAARKRRTDRPVTRVQRERADELFDRLSSLLRDAADPTVDPASVLRRADRAFEALHRYLRGGGALPTPWLDARR